MNVLLKDCEFNPRIFKDPLLDLLNCQIILTWIKAHNKCSVIAPLMELCHCQHQYRPTAATDGWIVLKHN